MKFTEDSQFLHSSLLLSALFHNILRTWDEFNIFNLVKFWMLRFFLRGPDRFWGVLTRYPTSGKTACEFICSFSSEI